MREQKACSVDECERQCRKLGWCTMHYTRFRVHGDPTKKAKTGQPTRPALVNFMNRVTPTTPEICWEWQGGVAPNGYGTFNIEGRKLNSHRAAYLLLIGPIPDGMHVMHSCDNPRCVNPSHLSLGTHQDNMTDMMLKGRNAYADDAGMAKLTSPQVVEMRRRREMGETVTSLAVSYGVGLATASRAINGVSWKKLKGES